MKIGQRSGATRPESVRAGGSTRGAASGRAGSATEAGHLLILMMTALAVLMIMLTVAAQSWTFQMRREMELELIFRGEQYVKGLDLFRKVNGGAFPVGDLKALTKKHVSGVRFMRKLYNNPFDPNGMWQYLYLHPGGTGFINPCATGIAMGETGEDGLPLAVPVSGFRSGGGVPGGTVFADADHGKLSKGDYAQGTRPRRTSGPRISDLTAMDPRLLGGSGIAKMNLPIVGVVNCEMRESIRTYKGQTWLSNWAFTPLAQGEFVASIPQGGAPRPVTRLPGGVGSQGSLIFVDPETGKPAGLEGFKPPDDGLHDEPRRKGRRHEQDEEGEEEEGDQPPDEEDPNHASDQQEDPNHSSDQQGDPNHPSDQQPGVISGEGDQGDEEQGDEEGEGEEDDGEDEEGDDDEGEAEEEPDPNQPSDPNHPADPNHPPSGGGSR